MSKIISFQDFKKKEKKKDYDQAVCEQHDIDPKTIEIQKAYDYLETSRLEANCYDAKSVAVVMQQVVANQLLTIQDQGSKVIPINYLLNLGKRVAKTLSLESKPEAHFLMHFLKLGYIDSIKLLVSNAEDPIVIVPIDGRVLICNSKLYWDGSSINQGTPSFSDSFSYENTLIEAKNALKYILTTAPELTSIIFDSPFWIIA